MGMKSRSSIGIYICVFIGLALCSNRLYAQQNSEFGWALSPHDTLRILVFFVEMDYEGDPLDKRPEGTEAWPKGQIPDYAEELFVPHATGDYQGRMSDYYSDISLGNLTVLGDYYPEVIRIRYDDVKTSIGAVLNQISNRFESDSNFTTAYGFGHEDFDLWEGSPGIGRKKNRRSGAFEGVDHVMLILRNYHRIPDDNGQASSSSSIRIAGQRSNTYSIFGGARRLPFGIMKHELNHLFLGGNNFHSGGGNSANFNSYLKSVQGGWSMMGAANSSLLTCAAWDRYRMGWKALGREHLIGALNAEGVDVPTDFDPLVDSSAAGVYILRDFVRSGDAIRIKMPHIPEVEFQQWIWLENHTTVANNGSETDRYAYHEHSCTATTPPGVYVQRQIDAESKEGSDIYRSVYADYLRPVLANGCFDFLWYDEVLKLEEFCINGFDYRPYELLPERENPLSGNHEQEFTYRDWDEPFGRITAKERLVPYTRILEGEDNYARFNFLGGADHAFQAAEGVYLGLGSNPSTASTLTMLNRRTPSSPDERNNRVVYLNGVRIDFLESLPDHSVKVAIRFDDYQVNDCRRWCAPRIVLSDHRKAGVDLEVNASLLLDRGETPLRFAAADTLPNGSLSFSDPTVFQLAEGAHMQLNCEMALRAGSRMEVDSDARLSMGRGARLVLRDSSTVLLRRGATFDGRGRIRIAQNALVIAEDEQSYRALRRRTFHKRRVKWIDMAASE